MGEECEAAGQARIELSLKLFHIMFKELQVNNSFSYMRLVKNLSTPS